MSAAAVWDVALRHEKTPHSRVHMAFE